MPLFPAGNPFSAATGQVTIVAGCDYKAADGNAAIFENAAGTWPNLTGASVYFVAQQGNAPPQLPSTIPLPLNFPAALIPPIQGTVTTPTGDQKVSFDLPASQTGIRPTPSPTDLYAFCVFAVLANGDVVPLITGPLQVLGVSA